MWTQDLLDQLSTFRLVLGSSSPRRREILAQNLGLPVFSVVKSSFEEDLPKEGYTEEEYVSETAKHKVDSIVATLDRNVDSLVIVADTVVCCGGRIFEKPETVEQQLEMLHHYKTHPNIRVLTSVNICKVIKGDIAVWKLDLASTHLRFNTSLSDDQLHYYASTKEGLGVAGGFKYQQLGSMLFVDLQGDYFNVVGLPVNVTFKLIQSVLASES